MNWNIGLTFFFLALTTVITHSQCPAEKTCIPDKNCTKVFMELKNAPNLTVEKNIRSKIRCKTDNMVKKNRYICCTDEEKHWNPNLYNHEPPVSSKNYRISMERSLLPTDCGDEVSSLSVGGETTKIDDHPWIAALEAHTSNGIVIICGGAIINNQYVLTAAHCVDKRMINVDWELKSVRLGEWDLQSKRDCEGDLCSDSPLSIGIQKKIIHQDYNILNDHHDIALLRLSSSINFTRFIRPICLPENEKMGKIFMVAGWGKTETTLLSRYKQAVKLNLFNKTLCIDKFMSHKNKTRQLIDSQICAGGKKGVDVCLGDSGGPLMQKFKWSDQVVRWTAFGITSFGFTPCGLENMPGVYTYVYHYKSWIIDNLEP